MADALLVFVIDDDAQMLERIKTFIETRYSDATIAAYSSGDAALPELYKKPDVIILDYHIENSELKNIPGIEILRRIKQVLPNVPVIFLSDMENEKISYDIIKFGAYDYIVRGDNAFQRLEIMINNATGHLSLRKEIRMQKIFNYALLLLIGALVVAFILSRMGMH